MQKTWLGDDVSKGMVYMKVSRHMFYRTLKYLLFAFGIIITILVIQQLLLPLIAGGLATYLDIHGLVEL